MGNGRRAHVLTAALALLLSAGLGAGRVRAQTPASEVPEPALVHADSLYALGDALPAFELLEAHLQGRPDDYDARWRAARAAVSIGLLGSGESEQNAWYRRGMAHGEEAERLRPEGIHGLFWLTANQGRLAIQLPPRASADAALEVYRRAHRILALDSLHAGAHNVLGKIDYEVMRLSRIERLLARTLTGNEAIRRASWAESEARLLRAVELDPAALLYHLDLGRVYLHTGRYDLAVQELEAALALPSQHPGDALYKEEAERDLALAKRRRGGRLHATHTMRRDTR